MIVTIPHKYLKDGDYMDNKNCPLAKTLKDLLPEGTKISVGEAMSESTTKTIAINDGENGLQIAISNAKHETNDFKLRILGLKLSSLVPV